MNFRSQKSDPFALGRYKHYTNEFRIAAWLFLFITALTFLDSFLIYRQNNETVLSFEDKIEYVSTGGKYGGTRPRNYSEVKSENLHLRLSAYEAGTLNIKPGDKLTYWQTFIFRQRLFLSTNGYDFYYSTYPNSHYKKVFYSQAALVFIGLLGFIPGQIRQMSIIMAALLIAFSFLHL